MIAYLTPAIGDARTAAMPNDTRAPKAPRSNVTVAMPAKAAAAHKLAKTFGAADLINIISGI